jgi:hypothetical protein
MTRTLTFTGPKAAKRFDLLRVALLAGGDGKGERTRETLRKEARLFDALDTVSDPAPTATDPDARVLRPFPAVDALVVTVSQEDFDLLTAYVDKTPWTPRASRGAVDVQDFLCAAERKD